MCLDGRWLQLATRVANVVRAGGVRVSAYGWSISCTGPDRQATTQGRSAHRPRWGSLTAVGGDATRSKAACDARMAGREP